MSGCYLAEVRYDASTHLPRHSHERAHLCFVLDGGYRETGPALDATRRRGDVLFQPSGFEHTETHGTAGTHLLIELAPTWLDRVATSRDGLSVPIDLPGSGFVASQVHRELRENDTTSTLVVEGLLLELVGRTLQGSARAHRSRPLYRRVRDVLHDRFAERVDLDELATVVGVHPVHLARSFRKHHGCTIGDYVRRLRVDHACERLRSTDDPFAKIAADAGFADQSHLSRTLKRVTGFTPSRYRATFRMR